MPFRLNSPFLIGLFVLCYGFFEVNHAQAQSNNPKTSSSSRAGMEKEQQELVRRINQTRQQLEEVRRKRKSGLQQLQLLKNQIQNREKIIRNYSSEIVRQEAQITEVENVVQSLQVDLKQLRERYALLLRQYQRQIMAPSMPLLILSAADVNQALRRTWHLRQYNQFRREQAAAIVDLQQELNQKGEVLQAEKERKEELKAKEEENKNALKQESQEQDKVVKALKRTKRNYAKNYATRKLPGTGFKRILKP